MSRVVEVADLRVELAGSGLDIVDEVSFGIDAAEIVAVVGESGSGKTTVGAALLGYARHGARIARGSVRVDGVDVLALGPEALRAARGKLVAYVPQDPATALNPAVTIGVQLVEALKAHDECAGQQERRERVRQTLAEVQLPDDDAFLKRLPHQLSGGQKQRVCIAMAVACRPRCIVFDEPTTGLDVTTQAHVLETVRTLCATHGIASVYITHDLAVVATLAHRVLVTYAGRIVEQGPCEAVFTRPRHPYTQRLVAATPHVHVRQVLEGIAGSAPAPRRRPQGCSFAPRCAFAEARCRELEPPLTLVAPGQEVRCVRAEELSITPRASLAVVGESASSPAAAPLVELDNVTAYYGGVAAARDVSFALHAGECLAVVGASGSGKTTIARTIVGLHVDRSGAIRLDGEELPRAAKDRPLAVRQALQFVFQNPYGSLNPRRSVGDIVAMPLRHFAGIRGREALPRVEEALERVSLSPAFAQLYPGQLSGGERQRVALARAMVCEPRILICDEITSALDVSVQASIVRLLERLRAESGLSMLFITHNLALVRALADRVVVMQDGRIVESGDASDVLLRASHSYTQRLLRDTPRLEPLTINQHEVKGAVR